MGLFDTILSNIKTTLDAKTAHQQEIVDCIEQIIHIKVPKDVVVLQKGILRITTAPTIKTAIFLKKETLITALQSRGIVVSEIL